MTRSASSHLERAFARVEPESRAALGSQLDQRWIVSRLRRTLPRETGRISRCRRCRPRADTYRALAALVNGHDRAQTATCRRRAAATAPRVRDAPSGGFTLPMMPRSVSLSKRSSADTSRGHTPPPHAFGEGTRAEPDAHWGISSSTPTAPRRRSCDGLPPARRTPDARPPPAVSWRLAAMNASGADRSLPCSRSDDRDAAGNLRQPGGTRRRSVVAHAWMPLARSRVPCRPEVLNEARRTPGPCRGSLDLRLADDDGVNTMSTRLRPHVLLHLRRTSNTTPRDDEGSSVVRSRRPLAALAGAVPQNTTAPRCR